MFDCSKAIPKKCQGLCCIHVALERKLWEENKHLAVKRDYYLLEISDEHVMPMTSDLRCIFNDPKTYRCTAYATMPCGQNGKNFGTGKNNMYCPYLKPNGSPRKTKIAKKFEKDFYRSDADARIITAGLYQRQIAKNNVEK